MTAPSPPAILYKYLGAARIGFLRQPRFRFSPPVAFNDPFDCRSKATATSTREMRVSEPPAMVSDWRKVLSIPMQFGHTSGEAPEEVAGGRAEAAPPAGPTESTQEQHPVWASLTPLDRMEMVRLSATHGSDGSSNETEPIHTQPPTKDYSILAPPFARSVETESFFVLHGGYGKQLLLADLGVLSLSEKCDHQLMWSHYSDSHRGFAVGLRTDLDFLARRDPRRVLVPGTRQLGGASSLEFLKLPPLGPVMYVEHGVSMFRSDVRVVAATMRHEIFDFAEFLFKSSAWTYEQEWRAFRRLANDRPEDDEDAAEIQLRDGFFCHQTGFVDDVGQAVCTFDVPKDTIAEFLIGLNMTVADRRQVANALIEDPELAHVRLRVARSTPDFGIAFDDIEPTSLLAALDGPTYSEEERLRADLREALASASLEELKSLEDAVGSEHFHSNVPEAVLLQVVRELKAYADRVQ